MLRFLYILLSFFIALTSLSAQDNAKVDFRPPLDIPVVLSGTFGELRGNHFHSGIDLKTQQVQGKVVHAITDGYVSRIKISPYGYGKALYISHPNGYTSVYGHLQHFAPEIESYIRAQQYALEKYAVDKYLMPGELIVKKGDTIAFSGNTGGSMGPHLHFELRKSANQHIVNPMQFDFGPQDEHPPVISGLAIYPAAEGSNIDSVFQEQYFDVQGNVGDYSLKSKDTISLFGDFYFAVKCFDRLNGAANKNGVYSVSLLIDSLLVYRHSMDELSFDQSRYINSLIDYKAYKQDKGSYQKSIRQPNNKLDIYKVQKDKGVASFRDGAIHHIEYQISDYNGNISSLPFILKSDSSLNGLEAPADTLDYVLVLPDMPFRFESEGMLFSAPVRAFYDTVRFRFAIDSACSQCIGSVYKLHHPTTPIHRFCKLQLYNVDIADSLRSKLVFAYNDDGEWLAKGGEWNGQSFETRIRTFGDYSLMVDTVSPMIKVRNVKNDTLILHAGSVLKIKLKDDFSGLDSYRCTLNGKWILAEFDAKNDVLIYKPDERIKIGDNQLLITAEDLCGNKNEVQIIVHFEE